MSIDDMTPMEWDKIFHETREARHYDNRSPKEAPYSPDLDPVNKPQHYRVGEVEAIDYIHQQLGTGVKDYLLGNIHKYLHRHRFKNGLEDLKKCQWYLTKLILEEEQGG